MFYFYECGNKQDSYLNIISLKIECDFETQTCKDKFELSLCFSNYI